MLDTEIIKILRKQTGAKVIDCKNALEEAKGDYDKALEILKEKGLESAKKRIYRLTKNGIVGYYVHNNLLLGVLVEIYCETSTAASTQIFKDFAQDIAMHIAAMKPKYIAKSDVPPNELQQIAMDKLQVFYSENCLMDQVYYKDTSRCVQDLFLEVIAKLRENVTVKRFTCFEVDNSYE